MEINSFLVRTKESGIVVAQDSFTIHSVVEGHDGYSFFFDNEAHTFVADEKWKCNISCS